LLKLRVDEIEIKIHVASTNSVVRNVVCEPLTPAQGYVLRRENKMLKNQLDELKLRIFESKRLQPDSNSDSLKEVDNDAKVENELLSLQSNCSKLEMTLMDSSDVRLTDQKETEVVVQNNEVDRKEANVTSERVKENTQLKTLSGKLEELTKSLSNTRLETNTSFRDVLCIQGRNIMKKGDESAIKYNETDVDENDQKSTFLDNLKNEETALPDCLKSLQIDYQELLISLNEISDDFQNAQANKENQQFLNKEATIIKLREKETKFRGKVKKLNAEQQSHKFI